MAEKVLIYVAGNPDAYPLEYYDDDTGTYEGIIPQMLRSFSENSGYEILYYNADGEDRRSEYDKNNQVDILSGYMQGDEAPQGNLYASLFSVERDGELYTYRIYFTDAAPQTLVSDLSEYLSKISEQQVAGMLIDSSVQPVDYKGLNLLIVAVLCVIIALLCVAAAMLAKYKKKLRRAEKDSETDELTGLGNSEYLNRYYKQYVNDKNRILYQMIYFFVDTERLQRLTTSDETDEFVRYCAVLLSEYAGDSDILARVSDRGFVMLKLSSDAAGEHAWLETLLERVGMYSQLHNKPFETKMFAGIYPMQAEDQDLSEPIFQATQSAYEAMKTDAGYIVCTNEMKQKFIREKQLQASIDRAFERNEFQLYLQFYVDSNSLKILGGEALSRWNHPQRGVLQPDEFIPLMEREKMIGRLDYYCLGKVCEFLDMLEKEGVDAFFVSCNFSRETFSSADFIDNVRQIIKKYAFPKELLIFEITESATARNVSQLQHNISALKEFGVRVALDDFGEGFTSFYDLHRYPVDGIKLDKGLIDYITTPSGRAILKAMIQVGHELNMTILAEGVESQEQVDALRQLGCDVIQGYRFYHPMPWWEAQKKITEKQVVPTA